MLKLVIASLAAVAGSVTAVAVTESKQQKSLAEMYRLVARSRRVEDVKQGLGLIVKGRHAGA